MKLKITKSDKKALLAALAVCGIGILFSILIVLGVDIYRKHTYTSVILPDAYRITDMKAKEHTSYSVNGDNTDYVYIITVKYEIDGTSYTDTLQILQGTHFATIRLRYDARITDTCRVLLADVPWDIISMDDIRQYHRWIEIKLKRKAAG